LKQSTHKMSTKNLDASQKFISPEDPVFVTLNQLEQNNPLAYHPNYLHPTTPLFSTSDAIPPIDPAHPPNYLHPTHPIFNCAEESAEQQTEGHGTDRPFQFPAGDPWV